MNPYFTVHIDINLRQIEYLCIGQRKLWKWAGVASGKGVAQLPKMGDKWCHGSWIFLSLSVLTAIFQVNLG